MLAMELARWGWLAARNLLSRPSHRGRSERGSVPGSEGVWLLGICFRARRTVDGQNGDRCRGVRGSAETATGSGTFNAPDHFINSNSCPRKLKDKATQIKIKKPRKDISFSTPPDSPFNHTIHPTR